MNFADIMKLFSERGDDREAIAKALGLTPAQIDALQRDCLRLVNEMESTDNRSPQSTGGE